MPSTSFAGRRPRYIEQYARTVAAYQRFDDITRDIASEQDRINYLDSLLQNENANLTNLNEVFRVRPPDASGAMELLRQQYASEDASRRRTAAGTARRAAGLSLPKAQADELEALLVNPTTRAPSSARDLAVSFITEDTTPEQVEDIIGILQAQGMDASLIAQVQQQADSVARGTAASGAARALSPEEQAAEQAMQQQLEALFFAGPAGIRGGYDGQAIVERREKTAAPKGVGFSTEEEAFQAALAALADGAIVVEDFSTEEDFEYAKGLYDEAAASQAYRNDQRINFEAEVLASRQRVAQLETARAEAPGAQYTDPGRERATRELVARGYKPDLNQGRYLQYQKSPYYDAMIQADDLLVGIIANDFELEAQTEPQRLAFALINQLDQRGRPYDIKKVERQLGKVLKGDELQEGLAFALATREYKSKDLQSMSSRQLLRDERAQAGKQEEQARAADAELQGAIDDELSQQELFVQRLPKTTTTDRAVLGARITAARAAGIAEEEAAASPPREFIALEPEQVGSDLPDKPATPAPRARTAAPAPAPVEVVDETMTPQDRAMLGEAPAPAAPAAAPTPAPAAKEPRLVWDGTRWVAPQ